MTPERYQQIKRLFQEVCRLEDSRRSAYLDGACADDVALRDEVEALLAHDEKSLPVRPGVTAADALGRNGLDVGAADGSSALAGFTPTSERIPTRIGHYRIVRKVGQGGMGVVFEAEQDNPRRTIALKVIRPGVATDQVLRRFKFEAQVLGRLQHPGIAQIYEAGIAEIETAGGLSVEQPFFAMEFIRGKPLSALIEQSNVGRRRRLGLFSEICDAVQHAHQKGVIHRDLKPSNILIDESGLPKILDFGVARVTEADVPVTTLQTDVGQLIGTLPYMSPEQVAGESQELDTRSDVYALGVICYQLLTGRLPYEVRGKTIPDAARTIAEQDPTPLSSIDRVFRGDLETIVSKALEKEKDRRYQSASDLAADVRRYLVDEPIAARPATAVYQFRKFARRNRMLVASLAGIVLVLAGGTVVSTALAVRAFDAEELAQQRLRQAEAAREQAEQRRVEAIEQAARAQAAEELAHQRFDQAEDARQLAEQNHQASLDALAKANTEATRATAFRDFLVGMLEHVNPETAQGRDVALLREVLDDAAAKIETELVNYPEVQASIHHVIGTIYRNISVYDEADRHLQTAYDLRVELLGEDNLDTVDALESLLQTRWLLGRRDELEQLSNEVISGYRARLGETHRKTLRARYDRAGILKELDRPDEAEAELREVVELMRAHLGEDDDALLEATNGYVLLAMDRGRLNDEIEGMQRAVVERWTAIHGRLHPKRLAALNNLALVVRARGDFDAAEKLGRESYDCNRELFGDGHHKTVEAAINLANTLFHCSKFVEAEPVAREALERATAVLGRKHPDTLKALNTLGIIARQLENYDEARACLEEAVALSEQLYGPHHPVTLNHLGGLAGLLYMIDELADAEAIMLRVVDGLREAYGERASRTLTAMNNFGLLLVKRGKLEEAEEVLLETIRLTDEAAPPGHYSRWNTRVSYGKCLVAMERFEDAEPLLLDSYAGLGEILGAAHHRTRGAAEVLASLYEAWGKPDEAAKYAEPAAAHPADADAGDR